MSKAKSLYTMWKKRGLSTTMTDVLTYLYWKARGTQTLAINGYTATFDSDIDRGGDRNRRRFPKEKTEISYLLDAAGPSDIVFDVGANTGLYTCFLANHVESVVAFEPYPPNAEQLYSKTEVLIHTWRTNRFEC